MKRILIALLLCLLPTCALAFDLSAYEIPDSAGCHVVPLDDGYTLICNPSYDARIADAARMAYNGGIIERITLPYDPEWHSRYQAFAYPDGTMGILGYKAEPDNTHICHDYTVYDTANGKLTHARPVPGSPTILIRTGGRFIGLREAAGQLVTLLLYDQNEQLLHELTLTRFHGRLQSACADGDAVLVMIELWDDTNSKGPEQLLTLSIAADGQIRWQNQVVWDASMTPAYYNRVLPDGQGGAFLIGSTLESYKIKSLHHIDQLGKVTWTKSLKADNAITNISAAIPNPDAKTVTFVGTVIANSRKLFDAFTMEIDLAGNMLSLDVRDFSSRGDYNFSCTLTPGGAAYAVSNSAIFDSNYDKPCVAVPLEALPKANDPGITMNEDVTTRKNDRAGTL